MTKKIVLSSIIALFFAAIAGGFAFAAETDTVLAEREAVRRIGVRGEVIALGEASFQFQTFRGDEWTVLVDDQTRFRGQITNFNDIQVGMKAGVFARYQDDGSWLAKLVFVPQLRPRVMRYGGRDIAIDLDRGDFTLQTRRAGEILFNVDENTRFRGKVATLSEMEVGFVALVGAREGDGGVLTAVLVAVPENVPPIRRIGEVNSVDVDNNQISLQTKRGEILTFTTDENTRFRSRSGEVDGLEDIEIGMRALVAGKVVDQEADELLAIAILVDDSNPRDDN